MNPCDGSYEPHEPDGPHEPRGPQSSGPRAGYGPNARQDRRGSRRHYRFVEMHLAPDPDADPYTVRAACLTCAQRSPAPDPAGTLADQHEQAQQWCLEHVARDHPDGRHLRYTATFTLRWRITPGEEIGPAAP